MIIVLSHETRTRSQLMDSRKTSENSGKHIIKILRSTAAAAVIDSRPRRIHARINYTYLLRDPSLRGCRARMHINNNYRLRDSGSQTVSNRESPFFTFLRPVQKIMFYSLKCNI